MTRTVVAGAFLLANLIGPAFADTCATAVHGGDLSQAAITTLLNPGGGVYACYNNGTKRENNETLLGSGQFQEYHTGGSTVQLEGTYTLTSTTDSDNASAGVITYTYTSGGTYAYYICSANSGTTYYFINTSGAPVIPLVVSASTSGC
jgi:hypothetical protein